MDFTYLILATIFLLAVVVCRLVSSARWLAVPLALVFLIGAPLLLWDAQLAGTHAAVLAGAGLVLWDRWYRRREARYKK